jgi:alkyl hydroperoxide reductase subunit AhpF
VSVLQFADNLSSVVRYALETTRATTICPFHISVTIRVGDDAAESHAFARARKIIRSDGTHWEEVALRSEFERQLRGAVDRYCPRCSCLVDDPGI